MLLSDGLTYKVTTGQTIMECRDTLLLPLLCLHSKHRTASMIVVPFILQPVYHNVMVKLFVGHKRDSYHNAATLMLEIWTSCRQTEADIIIMMPNILSKQQDFVTSQDCMMILRVQTTVVQTNHQSRCCEALWQSLTCFHGAMICLNRFIQ